MDWFKTGKEYIEAVYCHPAYLTYMQNTSCEKPDWVNHRLNQDCRRNINNFRYTDDTILMAESEEELKSLLMKVKEESEKAGDRKSTRLNSSHTLASRMPSSA